MLLRGSTTSPLCRLLVLLAITTAPGGCAPLEQQNPAPKSAGPALQSVQLSDVVRPAAHDRPITLDAAKNESVCFVLQASGLPNATGKMIHSVRVHPLQRRSGAETIGVEHLRAYQVLPMPVDTNRAGYVRHTGLSGSDRQLPRALLPAQIDRGVVNLSALRDTRSPHDPAKRFAGGEMLLWIDLHIPPETPPGNYFARCDLLQSGNRKPLASLGIELTVHDLVLPDERHLLMVSQLPWEDLMRLYPERFEAVTPRLMNRHDERYAAAVKTLDQLVKLAQEHRTGVVVPRLQPTAKWPAARPPQVDWHDFDSIVQPWLSGQAFADHVPLGYWPLPPVDFLDRFDPKSQADYWSEAAAHFEQLDWLNRSAVFIQKYTPGRAGATDSIQLSADAARVLSAHPRVRVIVPLEDDQLQLASEHNASMVPPVDAARVTCAATGLVFAPPMHVWPADLPRPRRWLRTDLPGLVPYFGAGGDERDVRLWAWLAFLRQAHLILWNGGLPTHSNPLQPADPNELIWFYPGNWFGVDEPVPTVQLKWLRRAQQDYEYLWLAKQRGEQLNATLMARLITKPVQIQPNQPPDPTYGLMCGTTDQQAWDDALRLLARTILLRQPGQAVDPVRRNELNLQTLQWIEPQERPLLLGRTTLWLLDTLGTSPGSNWVNLRLGIDIYNASDNTPDENTLQWTAMPPGWQVRPQPMAIPSLATYHVRRFHIDGRFNLDQLTPAATNPIEITFTNGFTKRQSKLRLVLPVAASDRREGRLAIDGALHDWTDDDAIHRGPLVRMFDRPALQRQEIAAAAGAASLYTGWAGENFYVAFKLPGVSPSDGRATRNFIDYQFRRAWGEDQAQILLQPVWADNTSGPILHLVCKGGGIWVERKVDPRLHVDPWQPVEGAAVRYAATLEGDTWRGEVAIPWKILIDPTHRGAMPKVLRFNFVQHHSATGQSASWAGPIDFGRDDSFMGLIYLREPDTPGMGEAVRR